MSCQRTAKATDQPGAESEGLESDVTVEHTGIPAGKIGQRVARISTESGVLRHHPDGIEVIGGRKVVNRVAVCGLIRAFVIRRESQAQPRLDAIHVRAFRAPEYAPQKGSRVCRYKS
jgi:hypothetical protein